MHIEELMQKAVSRFDWPAVETRLTAVQTDDLKEWAKNLLDVILRDGYLIVRRPDAGQKAIRDTFLEQLRSFLTAQGMAELLDDRADEFAGLRFNQWVAVMAVVGGGVVLAWMRRHPTPEPIIEIPLDEEPGLDEVLPEHLIPEVLLADELLPEDDVERSGGEPSA